MSQIIRIRNTSALSCIYYEAEIDCLPEVRTLNILYPLVLRIRFTRTRHSTVQCFTSSFVFSSCLLPSAFLRFPFLISTREQTTTRTLTTTTTPTADNDTGKSTQQHHNNTTKITAPHNPRMITTTDYQEIGGYTQALAEQGFLLTHWEICS